MKISSTHHAEKESIELEIFKEIKSLKTQKPKMSDAVYNEFTKVFDMGYYECEFMTVVFVVEDKPILSEGNSFKLLSENPLKLRTGDLVFHYQENFFKIQEGILDLKYLRKIVSKLIVKNFIKELRDDDIYNGNEIMAIDIREVIHSSNDFILKTSIEKFVYLNIDKAKKAIVEDRRNIKVEKNLDTSEKTNYTKDSVGTFVGFSVNRNIASSEKHELILEEPFNKFFYYEQLESITSMVELERECLDRQIGCTRKIDGKRIFSLKYEIVSGKTKIRINGHRIKSKNPLFIIKKIEDGATDEQIKIMNSLSGIKLKVTELEIIQFDGPRDRIDLPLSFVPLSKNSFTLRFLDNEQEISWNKIRELFLEAVSSARDIDSYGIRLTAKNLFRISDFVGIKKQDLFDYLKQATMLNSLGDDDV